MLRLLVCLKAVPAAGEVRVDGEYRLERGSAPLQWNLADESALEAALRLAKGGPGPGPPAGQPCGAAQTGPAGEVTVLSMGPAKLQTALQELLGRGAHHAALLTDPALAGADTRATAHALAAAAGALGPFDLILCGRRAIDGETGQVPGQLAAALGLPCVTEAEALDWAGPRPGEEGARGLHITRRLETGSERLLAEGPLVVSVCEYVYPLRLPGIAAMRRARTQPVRLLTAAELGLSPGQCGLAGSPTRVVQLHTQFAGRRTGPRETDPQKAAAALWAMLRQPVPHAGKDEMPKPEMVSPAEGGEDPGWVGEQPGLLVLCPFGLEPGLVQKAREMAGRPVRLLCPQADAAQAAAAGAGIIHTLAGPPPADEALFAAWLAGRVREWGCGIVLAPACVKMRGVMPQLAWRLNAGLTADCTALALESGRLIQTRPAFGNSLMAVIRCQSRVQMATVRPGTFRYAPAAPAAPARLIPETPPAGPGRVLPLGFEPYARGLPLAGAQVILAGGLGVGSRAGFEKLARLAAQLGGAAAASRAAVDAGFAPYRCQVGITGVTVRPRLYLALGISGAVQHLAGMSGADIIAAANTDPKAPIFDYADYGFVGDWQQLADAWLRLLDPQAASIDHPKEEEK